MGSVFIGPSVAYVSFHGHFNLCLLVMRLRLGKWLNSNVNTGQGVSLLINEESLGRYSSTSKIKAKNFQARMKGSSFSRGSESRNQKNLSDFSSRISSTRLLDKGVCGVISGHGRAI
ncbi:unnamed protein product [Hymenolepis diminuta]|uniref:Uncharacterized protein n=1 Tax=Hymenolepis diminuta TaxID=6216 RepID=A0A564YBL7_HYMDI|nr:unnamed protein product [Hymenolepis diminuta]